jgi:hypothetical protein
VSEAHFAFLFVIPEVFSSASVKKLSGISQPRQSKTRLKHAPRQTPREITDNTGALLLPAFPFTSHFSIKVICFQITYPLMLSAAK